MLLNKLALPQIQQKKQKSFSSATINTGQLFLVLDILLLQ